MLILERLLCVCVTKESERRGIEIRASLSCMIDDADGKTTLDSITGTGGRDE